MNAARMYDEARVLRDGTPIKIAMGPLAGMVWRKRECHTEYCVGDYEPKLVAALEGVVKPGDLCYDVGAHQGWTTALFAKLAGASGYVVAFEPIDANVREIEHNLQVNGLEDRVTVQPVVVCDYAGTTTFQTDPNSKQGKRYLGTTDDPRIIRVPCVSLDDYVFRLSGSQTH